MYTSFLERFREGGPAYPSKRIVPTDLSNDCLLPCLMCNFNLAESEIAKVQDIVKMLLN